MMLLSQIFASLNAYFSLQPCNLVYFFVWGSWLTIFFGLEPLVVLVSTNK